MIIYARAVIDWREDVEIWRQVSNEIRRRIRSGEYKSGYRLTQNAVSQEFGVAHNTARKAFAHLREQGLIYTRIRLGSFVGPEPPEEE